MFDGFTAIPGMEEVNVANVSRNISAFPFSKFSQRFLLAFTCLMSKIGTPMWNSLKVDSKDS